MNNEEQVVPARFVEELETLSALHRSCEIVYRSVNGGRTVIRDRIAGLFREEGEEWLRTAGGLVISLAALEQVDGMIPSKYC